ncbi:MAG: DUF6282 family protein [Eubacteriales bacterium]|nr:DUF6282 family protein [Eubacteriales bacterium]
MTDDKIYEPSLDEKRLHDTREEFSLLFNNSPKDKLIFKEESISRLLEGLIDFHIHAGPESGSNRVYDDDEIALEATKQGLKAVVYKTHTIPSFVRAPLVQKCVNRWAEENDKSPVDVVGGVVPNYAAGGLNPTIVEVCADLGGKLVWMPSINASHYYKVMGRSGGIDVLGKDGEVVPELLLIFEIIRDNNLILVLSHQSVYERFVLIKKASDMGVKKILLSHPLGSVNRADPEQIAQMVEMGAYAEVTYNTSFPNLYQKGDIPGTLKLFDLIGFDKIVGGSECSQLGTTSPAVGMELFLRTLLLLGVSKDDIKTMLRKTPGKLLYE